MIDYTTGSAGLPIIPLDVEHRGTLITSGGPATGFFDVNVPDEQTEEATLLQLGLTGYQRVYHLMSVMEQPTPVGPQWPSEDMFRLRVKLDFEEQLEKLFKGYYNGDPVQILDGACDVEVVGIGSIVAFGIDYDLAIAEVDRSNLSKLGEDGKPIKNEHGKFLKGPNYTPPNLEQFLHGLQDVPAPYDTKAIVLEETHKAVLKALDENGSGIAKLFFTIAKTVNEWAFANDYDPDHTSEHLEIAPERMDAIKDALVDNAVHGANVSIEEPEALIGGPNFGKRAYDSQFVTVDAGGCAPHVVIDKSE